MKFLAFVILAWCSIGSRLQAKELSSADLAQIHNSLEPIDYLEKITLYYDDQSQPFSNKQGKLLAGLAQKVHDLPINLLIDSFSVNSALDDVQHKAISDAKYQELLSLFTQPLGLSADQILYYYAGKSGAGIFSSKNAKGKKSHFVISFLREINSPVPLQDLLKEFRQRGFDVSMVRSVTPRKKVEKEKEKPQEIQNIIPQKINLAINFPTSIAMNEADKRVKGIGFYTELFLFGSETWGVNLSYHSFDYQAKHEKLDEFQFGGIYALNIGEYEFMSLDLHNVFNISSSQISELSGRVLWNDATAKNSSEFGISFAERATATFLIPGLSYHPLATFEMRLAKSYIDVGLSVGVEIVF